MTAILLPPICCPPTLMIVFSFLKLPARELEGLQDREHFLDAGYGFERQALQNSLVADGTDDRPLRALGNMGLQAVVLDLFDDMVRSALR